MPSHEDHPVSQEAREPASSDHANPRRRWFSWWWIWIPIIVVVTLWIGGWTFGNYGGPWGPKPQNLEPQISEPAISMLKANENANAVVAGRSSAQSDVVNTLV
jgi:heme A synthase